MKISLNWMKWYTDAPVDVDGPQAVAERIGAQLGAVEEVISLGEQYQGVVAAKVMSCEDHPNADRLHVCMVDDNRVTEGVERNEHGYVQVVCGAPNVREGMLVAWLPPGTTVPSTYGTAEPFVLEARELRGVVSNGMLASPKELNMGDSHDGILELDDNAAVGQSFADAYKLNDYILDIENKMFTHRPDCFGQLGVAREIAGIQQIPFTSPDWYRISPDLPEVETDTLPLEVRNSIPELVPRFSAIAISNVDGGAVSPAWLQTYLARVGIRPINLLVDLTNYYMVLTGQPLHAYDYDKVKALSDAEHPVIVIRKPKEGETIKLLNGKEIEPRAEAIMIATDKTLIGVGGVMGGADTEVDATTQNIILECAHFDMYSIRRTSMAHGLFSDAVTRFNKGQSPLQTLAILAKIVDDVRMIAGGKVAGQVVDDNHLAADILERGSLHAPVILTNEFVNARLGFELSAEEMATLLRNVEFTVVVEGDAMRVAAPFWRTDIADPEDIVEEVGRLYGYDHLPLVLPRRDLTPAVKDPSLTLRAAIARSLSSAGANEVLGYTFVHGDLLDKVGQDRDMAFRVSNALSPDLQYYRLSLTPSLLDKVHLNIKTGHTAFGLFEINKVHIKDQLDDAGLPIEFMRLGFVFAADDKTAASDYAGAPYYQARKYLAHILGQFNRVTEISFKPLHEVGTNEHPSAAQAIRPFEPNRSAGLFMDGRFIGVIGEYRPGVREALKLPAFSAGFELYVSSLEGETASKRPYVRLPRFPKVEQDICLKVPAATPYADVFQFVWSHIDDNRPSQTYHSLGPVDLYQRTDDTDHKQITLRLSIASYERTLTDAEINTLLDDVTKAAGAALSAVRV